VRALSNQAAVKHCVLTTHEARLPTQDELLTLAGQGVAVEDAGADLED